MRTKKSAKTQYYLIQVTPVSDAQLMALLRVGVEAAPTVTPPPPPQVKKPAKTVKSGRGGARPGAGRKPKAADGTTQHERVVSRVIKHLERGGPQRIVDLFEAVESSGSDEFGIRTNTPRMARVSRFRALLQREANRTDARLVKRGNGIIALSRKA